MPGGRYRPVPGDLYGGVSSTKSEYWFHRNTLDEFKRWMTDAGYGPHNLDIHYHEAPAGEQLKIAIHDWLQPRDYQIPIVDFICEENENIRVVTLQTGKGKASWVNAQVKVPTGFKRMGDIKPGEYVTAPDGTATEVLKVFPQGKVQLYKVSFIDGRSTLVTADHLWKVTTDEKGTESEWKVLSTVDVVELMMSTSLPVFVPLFRPPACCAAEDRGLLCDAAEKLGHPLQDGKGTVYSSYRGDVDNFSYVARCLGGTGTTPRRSPDGTGEWYSDIDLMPEYPVLEIVGIQADRVDDAQCIEVAHPDHLYVVDDFIVTHNTKTSLIAAARFGKKVLIMVPAMYTDMWYKEVETCFTHKKGDIILVKGLKALKAMVLLREAKEADPSVYIISSQTIALLLKEYETNPKLAVELCCRPERLMGLLGVGYRIIDEVHRNTLLNYKVDCYTNLKKAVYLSATLDTVDRFVGRMRSIAYPVRDRYTGLEYDKYIKVVGLAYNAENANKIRCRGAKGYSHIEFEKSIMKLQGRQKKYFNLITEIVKRKYVDVREPGQRCLVFAASVDFCAAYTKHLKALYPNLKIGKYTQEDNYQDMLTNDITVSTVLSAGTGVDVAGLRTVVMSNSMDSWSANEQVKGRLRRLADWPEISPEFYYIFCSDIPKHVDYHQRKMDYFKDKCLSHHVYNSGFCI